jgi:ATP-binding cassette subfamily B (MDR/TAP) protein 1
MESNTEGSKPLVSRLYPYTNKFNYTIQTVALVGESGSGKSTVISLLQRFYDPDSGHITLDGIEIQKLQLKWLRLQMGLVSQEPVLFNDTIRANIAYGKEGNATEAEILAAAELANAHKFISSLQKVKNLIKQVASVRNTI